MAIIYDGETIGITSRKDTTKVDNLRRDPRITVCVAHPQDPSHYVTIQGTADVEDDTDRSFVNAMARDWMGMDEYPYDEPGAERVKISVRPEIVSCPKVHGSDA